MKLKLQYSTWCEELTHLKRPWCWERLRAGGEGDDRGWDGWMASLTQWTWVWVDSGSWWWTGRPGVLQFTGLQRVGHDWATELNWTDVRWIIIPFSTKKIEDQRHEISKSEFLNLSMIDIWGQKILCHGSVLCIIGCLIASLAFTHWMLVATPPPSTTKNVSRYWQMSPWGERYPKLQKAEFRVKDWFS